MRHPALARYIDQGGHPELFASAAVSKGYEENQRSRGKAEAFAQLRDAVLRRAREAFPEETAAYLRASGEAAEPSCPAPPREARLRGS
mmetsp:Transcript_2367/g.5595  ORF Transcript_2367/g.5595 Transcript_2367/m.5595 type:complete len:88 (+) Transcript_2367:839-1102(+)